MADDQPGDVDAQVGQLVRAHRESRGLSQAQLAEAVGWPPALVEHTETGQRSIRPDELLRLATALNVPATALLPPKFDRTPPDDLPEPLTSAEVAAALCKHRNNTLQVEAWLSGNKGVRLDVINVRYDPEYDEVRIVTDPHVLDEDFPDAVQEAVAELRHRFPMTDADWLRAAATRPDGTHLYLSTGCLHGDHEHCRCDTTTSGAPKVPGRCKFCASLCLCACDTGTAVSHSDAQLSHAEAQPPTAVEAPDVQP